MDFELHAQWSERITMEFFTRKLLALRAILPFAPVSHTFPTEGDIEKAMDIPTLDFSECIATGLPPWAVHITLAPPPSLFGFLSLSGPQPLPLAKVTN